MKPFLRITFFFFLAAQICFGQWYQQNSPTTQNLNAVTFIDANIGFVIGDSGTILRTSNAGTSWSLVPTDVTNKLTAMSFTDDNNGWIVGSGPYPIGDSAVILRTTDGGMNWKIQKKFARSALADIHFVDYNLGFAVGWVSPGSWDYSFLLKTTDGGATWTQVNYDSLNVPQKVHFFDTNNGWMMRGVCGNGCGGDIRRTTDGGTSWSVNVNGYFSDLQVIDSDKAIAVWSGGWQVIQTGYAMQTNDGGLTWRTQIIGFDLGTVSVRAITDSIAVIVTHNYAGMRDSLYWTTDGGTTWIPRPNPTDEHLSQVYFTDVLTGWAVGTNGTILHTTNGGVTFIEDEQIDEVPAEYFLSQNYPNPFNSSSVIKYSVSKLTQVSLKIFNALGSEIETLVNEEKPVGNYELNWSSANLPSGVYFYRLQAGSFVQTRKMILLK